MNRERLLQAVSAPTPNPLQQALNDYHLMEAELGRMRADNQTLRAENQGILSEVNMLREALERADGDRIRLQAISSTLLGRLLAINDCIGGAVKASIRDGIEASEQVRTDPALEQAASDVQRLLQRVEPISPPPEPPTTQGRPRPPVVEWRR